MTESQFIRKRCLEVIRKAAMNESSWEMTILDAIHSSLSKRLKIKEGEYPIISFFAGDRDWTIYTTRRLIGESDGVSLEIESEDFASWDYGNFKQDLDSPRVIEAVTQHKGRKAGIRYESGYASMAPIYYFRFWKIKWPVWKKTYELGNTA